MISIRIIVLISSILGFALGCDKSKQQKFQQGSEAPSSSPEALESKSASSGSGINTDVVIETSASEIGDDLKPALPELSYEGTFEEGEGEGGSDTPLFETSESMAPPLTSAIVDDSEEGFGDNELVFEELGTDSCASLEEVDYIKTQEQAEQGVKVAYQGKFCPDVSHKLNLVFIVDNSGSMGWHYNPNTWRKETGNDPQINGSCGRLEGAKAVIRKFMDSYYENVQIEISVISFASDVIETRQLKEVGTPLNENLVTTAPFCQTVIQSSSYAQPGGISVPGIFSGTNYQAPFNAANQLLRSKEGKKIIYFITDGNPNTPAPEENGIALGIEAANQLRGDIDKIAINALFLKAHNPDEAKSILEQITGDRERVLLADNSDEIKRRIVEFPELSLGLSSLVAKVSVGNQSNNVAATLIRDVSAQNNWIWKTSPFELIGKNGSVVENILTVTVEDSFGNIHKSIIRIHYSIR